MAAFEQEPTDVVTHAHWRQAIQATLERVRRARDVIIAEGALIARDSRRIAADSRLLVADARAMRASIAALRLTLR